MIGPLTSRRRQPARRSPWTLAVVVLSLAGVAPAPGPAADGPLRWPGPASQAPGGGAGWKEDLRAWLAEVARHEPGQADAAAESIGSWPETRLDQVRKDFLALAGIYRAKAESGGHRVGVAYRHERFTEAGVGALLGFPGSGDNRPAVNRVIARAAVLHADIALRVTPLRRDDVGCAAGGAVLILDGQVVRPGCVNYHWGHVRALLEGRWQEPWINGVARLWYHATIVRLLEANDYTDAWPQIDRARRVWPRDAAIAFEEGYYGEALAAPRVQALTGPTRRALSAQSAYLRLAESSFRLALALDARVLEARVRLGAVLTQLERYEDAAATLRQVPETPQPPLLRYYAALFLGRAEERLGHAAAARGHYERAQTVFPTAQAPMLALGRLARSAGDRATAEPLVRRTLEVRARQYQPEDPWSRYNIWQSQDSETLLRELFRLVTTGAGP